MKCYDCPLQELPSDFRLRMAVHSLGLNYGKAMRHFCEHLGLHMHASRVYCGSRTTIYGLLKIDHLLYYADGLGDREKDRPVYRTKDFVFVKERIPSQEIRGYLITHMPINHVLGYYQWELSFAWDHMCRAPLTYEQWKANDGLANGALHERQSREGRYMLPCGYAPALYRLRLNQIADLQRLLGEDNFAAFMELRDRDWAPKTCRSLCHQVQSLSSSLVTTPLLAPHFVGLLVPQCVLSGSIPRFLSEMMFLSVLRRISS